MRLLLREAWKYAALLILLFAIAGLAVWHTLDFIEPKLSVADYPIVAVLIWVLTMGFMLIAGAFGLWAIQFSAGAESRRRIGRLVDAMDCIQDGLLAIDRRGRINGSNPAAHRILSCNLSHQPRIRDVLPGLSSEDAASLLRRDDQTEIECFQPWSDGLRTLRLRSQTSGGVHLILLSDVTALHIERQRRRQAARLQLIGQLARGVAYDFNHLLNVISAHASAIAQQRLDNPQVRASTQAISENALRGAALAAHLTDLSRSPVTGHSTNNSAHVTAAAENLRNTLPPQWTVTTDVEDLPSVGLNGLQIEQVVLNLGLLAADASPQPGTLRVSCRAMDPDTLFETDRRFAAVLLVDSTPFDADSEADWSQPATSSREVGVIQSVLLSLLQEAGGTLESRSDDRGNAAYRVRLPPGSSVPGPRSAPFPSELSEYMRNWTVLLGCAGTRGAASIAAALQTIGMQVLRAENIAAALSIVESAPALDVMILDRLLLRQETAGLLRAILKLRPSSGVVMLADTAGPESPELRNEVVIVPEQADHNRILTALIEARTRAAVRVRTAAPQDPRPE